jgi:hypothetical protein
VPDYLGAVVVNNMGLNWPVDLAYDKYVAQAKKVLAKL